MVKYLDLEGLGLFKDNIVQYFDDNALIQVTTMPTASVDNYGDAYQYIGTTTASYINGTVYRCVYSNNTYSWEPTVSEIPTAAINNLFT